MRHSSQNQRRKVEIETENLIITDEFKEVLSAIDANEKLIFLTGKAGTGKTTLIDVLRKDNHIKSLAVVAPTGIAALNIRGQTIHSFFRIKPGQEVALDSIQPLSGSKLHSVDTVIIDEISMARPPPGLQ